MIAPARNRQPKPSTAPLLVLLAVLYLLRPQPAAPRTSAAPDGPQPAVVAEHVSEDALASILR